MFLGIDNFFVTSYHEDLVGRRVGICSSSVDVSSLKKKKKKKEVV